MPSLSTVADHAITGAADVRAVALSPITSLAIEDWWRRGATDDQMQLAQDVFRQCKVARHWIGCDCRGANNAQRPLMGVFEREGKLYLRRMQDRPLHDVSCVYFREHHPSDVRAVTKEAIIAASTRRPETPPAFYSIAADLADPLDQVDDEPPPAEKHSNGSANPYPTMARKLRWLLDAAGANVFPQERNIVARLIGVAQRTAVGPFSLDRYMYFSPKAFAQGLVSTAAERAIRDGLQEHAYLVTCVAAIDDDDSLLLAYKDTTLPLRKPHKMSVYRASGADNGVAAPYIALMMVNKNRDVVDAYLHPIYKPDFFCLVDSNEERKFLSELLSISMHLREQGVHCRVMKPLYALARSGVLPDFHLVLRRAEDMAGAREIEVVIEVLGFDNAGYRLKKQLQAVTLEREYRYIAYDTRATVAAERAAFTSAVLGVANELR
jgi:hypothetical protein